MTTIDIVGGVYREKCAFPYWDELYGSAGRAAAALQNCVSEIRLHTLLADEEVRLAKAIFSGLDIDIRVSKRHPSIQFEYVHCLSTPTIHGREGLIDEDCLSDVEGDVVIKFGMLECDPKVRARICVYDPQSAYTPKSFSESGSMAERLAIVANKGEIRRISGEQDIETAANCLIGEEGAEVIIVKDGINGASVFTKGRKTHIPAYRTNNVFTIGSGDVFVAAFAFAWGMKAEDPTTAAKFASLATAEYVESRILPIIDMKQLHENQREAVVLAGGKIYLAGPFRETGQRMMVNDALEHLSRLGMTVFSPIHEIGPGKAEKVVRKDLEAIQQCDAMFAILNGSSPGTVFEVGYAISKGKPVFCVTENMRDVDLKLPEGSGAILHDDYVSALHKIAWRK